MNEVNCDTERSLFDPAPDPQERGRGCQEFSEHQRFAVYLLILPFGKRRDLVQIVDVKHCCFIDPRDLRILAFN